MQVIREQSQLGSARPCCVTTATAASDSEDLDHDWNRSECWGLPGLLVRVSARFAGLALCWGALFVMPRAASAERCGRPDLRAAFPDDGASQVP